MYSYGPPHMAEKKQDDQLRHISSSYVRIRDVALKTCRGRWTIGRSGERGSGISVLVARHDDDDGLHLFWDSFEEFCLKISRDTKYFFPLLSKALWSRINSCYSIRFSNLKQKKKNTTLLLVELLAIVWVPCISDTLYISFFKIFYHEISFYGLLVHLISVIINHFKKVAFSRLFIGEWSLIIDPFFFFFIHFHHKFSIGFRSGLFVGHFIDFYLPFLKKSYNLLCSVTIISYLPTPPLGQDMTQGQFFKRSLTGLNSEFSFS